MKKETKVKKQMRRENEACFIPKGFYFYGWTQKHYFVFNLQRAINKVKESDKKCV